MASRDLTSQFLEYRQHAVVRRRSTMNPTGGGGGGGGGAVAGGGGKRMFQKGNDMAGSDDLLLSVEDGTNGPYRRGKPTPTSSSTTSSSTSSTPQHLRNSSSVQQPPKWVHDVEAIHTVIADIARLVSVLNSLHASRLGSVFGKDLEDKEGQIERLTRDITDRFREAERLLQRVGVATKRSGGEEATVGANVQRSLAKKLQELSVDFRQKQRKYLHDVRAQKGSGLAENEAQFGIDLHAPQTTFDMNSNTAGGAQSLAVVDDLQAAVQSRDVEIAQIAQSIEELGSIFKELAVLVIDQGTILDRIDYNMEAVVEHTREGIQQLEKAEKQQKSARPMKCIMCLLTMIAVLLVILVLKHRH